MPPAPTVKTPPLPQFASGPGALVETFQAEPVPVVPKYWIGLIDGAPFDYIGVGGITFHKRTEDVSDQPDSSGQTIRIPRKGQIVPLSDAIVERIKRAAARKVVRRNAPRPMTFSLDDPRYIRDASDTPISRYIYMQQMPEVDAQPTPPPLG